jgi:uncharacterized protein (TIRG00374 family)
MMLNKFRGYLIRYIVIALLASFTVWNVDFLAIKSHLTLFNILIIIFLQPLIALSIIAAGKRLSDILSITDKSRFPFMVATKATILANGSCVFLPAKLSELLKPIYIRNYKNTKLSVALTAVILERLMDIFILAFFAIIGFIIFIKVNFFSIMLLVSLTIGLFIFIIFFESSLIKIVKIFLYKKFQNTSIEIIQMLGSQLKNRENLWPLFYGLIAWILSYLNVAIILILLNCEHIGFKGYFEVFLGSIIGGAIPALPAGFGTYEASVIYILEKYGVDFNKSLAVALTLHISQLLLPVIGALLLLIIENIGVKKLVYELKGFSSK